MGAIRSRCAGPSGWARGSKQPRRCPSGIAPSALLRRTKPGGATRSTQRSGRARWAPMSIPCSAPSRCKLLRALEQIWTTKPETAGRVRGRIESVLDWATARGYRQGENPARWRGHLENLLPKKSKVRRVKHHAALPYAEIATFIAEL